MNLHEYYHYLQQLPQQAIAMLQQRFTQPRMLRDRQNITPHPAGQAKRNMVNKKKLTRKTFSRKPKP